MLRAFIIQADNVARLASVPPADRAATSFPPPDCEVVSSYPHANRGDVMDVLLQFLEAGGVIPRSISATPCPEEWKEFGGQSGIEEVILTGQEAKEIRGCLATCQLDPEKFRNYWCRYINGHSADPEPSSAEREAFQIAERHLAYLVGLLHQAGTCEWFLLLEIP